jgi:DNA-binding HxlR family transcriptional regulator
MCGISSTLDLLGDKWSLLILRDMLFFGKNTYGDFLNSNEKIATNILADRLLLLENEGIITKQIHPDNKSKYLYNLTQKGKDILPVLLEMLVWSGKYLDVSERGKAIAQKFRDNREEFINRLLSRIQ